MAGRLFEPTDQSMFLEYPELQDIAEFRKLSDSEMAFVWFWSNRQSPHYHIPDNREKVDKCVREAYTDITTAEIREFEKGNFSPAMLQAMDRMEKFAVQSRSRAKSMVDKIFDTLETIVNESSAAITLNSLDSEGNSIAKVSDYIDNTRKITDQLPILIKMKEEGFGFKQRKGKAEGKEPTLMDKAFKGDD